MHVFFCFEILQDDAKPFSPRNVSKSLRLVLCTCRANLPSSSCEKDPTKYCKGSDWLSPQECHALYVRDCLETSARGEGGGSYFTLLLAIMNMCTFLSSLINAVINGNGACCTCCCDNTSSPSQTNPTGE